jgi:mono/diheme cytochrome c family protein
MAGALTEQTAPPAPPRRPAPDRRVKVALLLGSGVTLAFLVAAMIRENFLSEWRFHQRQYRQMLLDSPNKQQRQLGAAFEEKVRQIDLPQLGTTDRCVSCHVGLDNPAMADARQPFRPHSGDVLKHHPVEKYGCTVCHQGQGAATNFHEAKATDVFWDYPLLPPSLTQASCGSCHAPASKLMKEHAPALAHGRELFLDRGCQSCHKLDGVGGQLGPALDGVGSKIKHQLPMAHVKGEPTLPNWLTQHFASPQAVVPGSQMRPPRLTPAENKALTIYMLSLRKHERPQSYVPGDRIEFLDEEIHHKPMRGDVLYNRYCVSCHGDGTFGTWDKFFNRFMPAVRGPGLRAVAAPRRWWQKPAVYLRAAIEQGRPGTLMPAWGKSAGGLTKEQIDSLIGYLAEGDGRPPQKLRPAPVSSGGDARRGGELFTQLCAGCHGANKLAPSLGNPVFQKTADDNFFARTIVNGRADTAMPAFQRDGADGLTDAEVRDLVAYVRSLGKKP